MLIVVREEYTLAFETKGELPKLMATALLVIAKGKKGLRANLPKPIEIPPEIVSVDRLDLGKSRSFIDRIALMEVSWASSEFLGLSHNWALGGTLGGEVRLHAENIIAGQVPVAEFCARGRVNVTLGGNQIERSIALTVVLRELPRLRLDLDDFNIGFPEIDFPNLDLGAPLPLPSGAGIARLFDGLLGQVSVTLAGPVNAVLILHNQDGKLCWGIFTDDDGTTPALFNISIMRNETQLAQINALTVTGLGPDAEIGGTISVSAGVTIGDGAHELGGLTLRWQGARVAATATADPATLRAQVSFERLVMHATADPSAVIALTGQIEMTPSGQRIVQLAMIEPYPAPLITAAQAWLGAASRIVPLRIPFAGSPRLRQLVEVLGRITAAITRSGGAALQGLAKMVGQLLDGLSRQLESLDADRLAIELRIATDPPALRQVLVTLDTDSPPPSYQLDVAGLRLDIPGGWQPGLLIDLGAAGGGYLVVSQIQPRAGPFATLSTDLWLKRGDSISPMRDADPESGDRAQPEQPLLSITANVARSEPLLLVLAGVSGGRAIFFQKVRSVMPIQIGGLDMVTAAGDFVLEPVETAPFEVEIAAERVLPLLGMGERGNSSGNGFLDRLKSSLAQTVWVKGLGKPEISAGKLAVDLMLGIRAAGVESAATLGLQIALDTLEAELNLQGNKTLLKSRPIKERALGLDWVIERRGEAGQEIAAGEEFEMFRLVFDGNETSLELTDKARMEIRFTGLSSDGKGVALEVEQFRVSRAGLDLTAKAKSEPVRLNGIDVPFRFTSGAFVIQQGRLTQAAIGGRGTLPRQLVGDVDCALLLNFVQDPGSGDIVLQSGQVEFDKKGQPVFCEATRFTLTLQDLGIAFVRDGGSYHFYFLLTGAIQFTPRLEEFDSGLLQFLADVRINLERVPLAGDPKVLLRHISFQKALNPKRTFSLFNLFEFELRGFGFHPSSSRFDGDPAINISGQILFADFGDVMKPEIDFHGLWIAGPAPGEALPRVKADGLGVGIGLSGVARIRGNVLAVDPQTPSLQGAELAPPGYDAYGFLGQGELAIDGWGAMAASMGFMEVAPKDRPDERRKSFFLYLEQQRLAVEIPVGVWIFYMREVGFGFGYRYTLRGIKDAEAAGSTAKLVQILDDVSKRQGDLANFGAWLPDPEGDKVTLAMRAAFQCSPASKKWNQKREESASEPFFFDIVAALRSDMTFLMAARGWVATNYWDFHTDTDGRIRENPGFRGYFFLSAPRKEMLARCIGDSRGYIGTRLENIETLKQSLKSVDWSMTLYIDPSVFHLELGWPNELVAKLRDDRDFRLVVRGGMIFRAAEDGLLWGYNIEASALIRFSGSMDGGSLGMAIEASLTVDFVARLVAFLSWRVSGSFLYGLVALHAGLEFKVRAWMKIDLGFTSFSINISFFYRVQFTASVELAISTSGLGAKVVAPVGVPAFGCMLWVTVSFVIGDGSELEEARSRVQRFLSLGIANPGRPDQTPAAAITEAEAQLTRSAEQADRAAAAPRQSVNERGKAPKPPILRAQSGHPIQPTDFWLVLHQAGDDPARAYGLLVPREAADQSRSSFYCAPHGGQDLAGNRLLPRAKPDLTTTCQLQVPAELTDVLRWDAETQGFQPLRPATCIPVKTRWDAPIPTDQPSNPVFTLAHLFDECFLYDAVWSADGRTTTAWTEPPPLRHGKAREAGTERERANLQRDRQAEAEGAPLVTAVRQARSTVLSLFLDQFVTLARTGKRERENAHVTDLGLVFKGDVGQLEQLELGRMTVAKTDVLTGQVGTITVLNPREKWFDRADPMLAHTRDPAVATDGIRLDWRLTAPFATEEAGGPEQFLHYYEITAEINGRSRWAEPRLVKPALTLGKETAGEIATMRPEWQFTDDLSDLSETRRRALLPGGGEEGALLAAQDWITEFGGEQQVVLTYSVIPVDIAGTRGSERSFIVAVPRPQVPLRPARAELRFFFTPPYETHHGAQTPRNLWAVLALDDAAWDQSTAGREVRRSYRLILDPEDVLPSGYFGSDGLTDRRQAGVAENTPSRTGDEVAFEFSRADYALLQFPEHIEPDAKARQSFSEWFNLAGKSQEPGRKSLLKEESLFFDTLWRRSDGGRVAVRFSLETLVRLGEAAPLVSRRVPVDFEMKIETAGGADGETVVLRPDAFEWPVRLDLPPLTTGEVRSESGFALVRMPVDTARLSGLLAEPTQSVAHLRDPERRILTRVEWDALPGWAIGLPGGEDDPSQIHASAIAGYDLHELDIDEIAALDGSLAEPNAQASAFARNRTVWAKARRVSRVQLLPDTEARLMPDNNAELLDWDAHYPSETWRLKRAAPPPSGDHRPVRRPWWSAAETAPCFPERLRRLRLLTVPDESLVAALLRRGSPSKLFLRLSGQGAEGLKMGLQDTRLLSADPATAPVGLIAPFDDIAPGGPEWLGWSQITRKDGKTFTPADLRALQLCLVLPGQDATTPGDLTLHLAAEMPAGRTATAEVALDFSSPLHPILQEVLVDISHVAVGNDQGSPQIYRRFTPALQPAPALEAADLNTMLAATAPGKDPYGWGVLQALGLSVTLRLHDAELREFIPAEQLLERLDPIMQDVIGRYRSTAAGKQLGVPFAEILLRPGADRAHASFDAPASPALADSWNWGDALAAVQVSLRPVADMPVWSYWRISGAWKRAIAPPPPAPGGQDAKALLGLRLVAPAGAAVEVLRPLDSFQQALKAGTATILPILHLPSGATRDPDPQLTVLIRAKTPPKDSELALGIELVWTNTDETQLDADEYVQHGDGQHGDAKPNFACVRVHKPGQEGWDPTDPFERFAPPDGEAWQAELFNADQPPLRGLGPWLAACLPELEWPETPDAEKGIAILYLDWAKRFLDHAAGPDSAEGIHVALAAPNKNALWRVAASAEGRVSVSFLHSDRWGHVRAYAVKPYGRYQEIMIAARAYRDLSADRNDARAMLERLLTGARYEDRPLGHAIAVSPRTEKVEPPVILDARLVSCGESDGQWQVVVPHHNEMRLAASNRPLFARLGWHGVALSFAREYRDATWPNRLMSDGPAPILYPVRRPLLPACPDQPGGITHAKLGDLAELFPSLWQGADIYRFAPPPHFYRANILAVARAGIAVSPISLCVQEAFRAGMPKFVPAPQADIRRGDDGRAQLTVDLRLLSYADFTPEAVRKIWLPDGTDSNDIAHWPDPEAIYVLEHHDTDSAPKLIEEEAELRLIAEVEGDEEVAPLVLRVRGTRYEKAAEAQPRRQDGFFQATFGLQLTPSDSMLGRAPVPAEMDQDAQGAFNKQSPPHARVLAQATLSVAPQPAASETAAAFNDRVDSVAAWLEGMTGDAATSEAVAILTAVGAQLRAALDELPRDTPPDALLKAVNLPRDISLWWPRGIVPDKLPQDCTFHETATMPAVVVLLDLPTADDINQSESLREPLRKLARTALGGGRLMLRVLHPRGGPSHHVGTATVDLPWPEHLREEEP